jgi:SpoVK/Ycf46/Vps4 family AAA+-type ATPase
LDECDYIARSRTARLDIGEASRIVNTLLQMLEEFHGPGLVVATTNIDKALDEALFRRFDDAFMVPLPSDAEIQRLLELSLSAMTLESGAILTHVGKRLSGESAAAVVKIARDAAKLAVLEESPRILHRHFEAALRAHGTTAP